MKESFTAEESSFIKNVCLIQNNDISSEDLVQFHKTILEVLTSRRADRETKKESENKSKDSVIFVTSETLKIHKSKITTRESRFYTFRKSFFQIVQEEHDKRITAESSAFSSSDESLSSDLWSEEFQSIELLSLKSSSTVFSESKRQIHKKIWQQLFRDLERILTDCINQDENDEWFLQSSFKVRKISAEQKEKNQKVAQERARRN